MKRRFVNVSEASKAIKEHIEGIEDFTAYVLKLIQADIDNDVQTTADNETIVIKNPNYRPIKVRIEPVNQPPILFIKDK